MELYNKPTFLIEGILENTEIIVDNSVDKINEQQNNPKNYYIKGIFLQSEIINKNRRIYPKNILFKEANRYNKEKVLTDRAVGELGHPEQPSINYDRVSHKIMSLEEKGNDIYGTAKIINTPMGNIVKSLIDEGIKFAVSSRALGSVKHDSSQNADYVCEDFYLISAADIVADPGAPQAYVNAIVENKNWAIEHLPEDIIDNAIEKYFSRKKHNSENLMELFKFILNKVKKEKL